MRPNSNGEYSQSYWCKDWQRKIQKTNANLGTYISIYSGEKLEKQVLLIVDIGKFTDLIIDF